MTDTDLNLKAEAAPEIHVIQERVYEWMDKLEKELGVRPTPEQMVEALGIRESKTSVMESLMEGKE